MSCWRNSAGAFRIILRVLVNMTGETITPASPDPKPVRPDEADYAGCCDSGCSPCIYDLYWEALERYEKALAEWETRNAPEVS